MTCAHYQDMEGWPSYWEGFPPLMHPTHAIGPCFMLLNDYPKEVYAKGSGRIRDELIGQYNSPFAFESALVTAMLRLKWNAFYMELPEVIQNASGYMEAK